MAGEFDLSARITADASGLVQAAGQAEGAYDGIGRSAKEAATGARELETATDKAGRTQGGLVAGSKALTAAQTETMRATKATTTETLGQAVARERAARETLRTAAAEARLEAAQNAAERSAAAAALATLKLEQAQSRLGQSATRTGSTVEAAANRQSYAVRNLGQQFGDFGTQVALGGGFARAFASQAGQMGYALSEFGGKLGAVGSFLVGPWGIALTTAAVLAAPFIEKMFEGADAATKAEIATSGLSDATSDLAAIFGKASSKIAEQNELLRINARIKAANLRIDAATAEEQSRQAFGAAGRATRGGVTARGLLLGATGGALDLAQFNVGTANTSVAALARRAEAASRLKDPRAQGAAFDKIIQDAAKTDFAGSKVDRSAFLSAISQSASAPANRRIADLIDSSLDNNKIDPLLATGGRTKRTPRPKSTEARDEFGRDAADKIASIVGQFDEAPAVIDKTNAKVRELDDLIDDLNRKKPPNFAELVKSAEAAKVVVREGLIREVAKAFEAPKTLGEKAAVAIGQLDAVIADLTKNEPPGFEKLISDAEKAKAVVRDGLQRPYNDFVKSQRESLEIGELVLQGRVDEANALKQINTLEATGLRLNDAQKAAILATTEAVRAQARAVDDLRERNAKYLEALGGIKGVLEDATQAFVRGDLGQILKSPKKLLDVFQTLKGRELFDGLFGGAFKDLEDQINGVSPVKEASAKMAKAVDLATASIDKTTSASDLFEPSLSNATDSTDKFAAALDRAAGRLGGPGFAGNPQQSPNGRPATVGENGEIVVTAQRDPKPKFDANLSAAIRNAYDLAPALKAIAQGKAAQIKPDVFRDAITKASASVAKLFTNPQNAAAIGASIGKFAGKGLEGAATGAMVSGVAKAVGIRLNSTGSQVGGAIGQIVGGPIGGIVGSIGGGILGNIIAGPRKPGGATVSNVNGSAGFSGTAGTDKAGIQIGKDLAGSVANGINAIAQQLGGQLGNFNVSIGKYKDDLRVNTNGRALGGVKNSGAVGFGDDAQAAVSYAISQAIAQGAVSGLSEAVQRALKSSTDVDRALAEALKVREVETLIGGIGSTIKVQFDAFDKSAAERVRVARQYGLDVLAIEKINGEQRAKLVDDTLKSRIGSLSDFLDQLKFGDLSEGTAVDKRNAILERIKAAQADAEAGKDGAADLLAQLYGQLVQGTRDAFGTAGTEYGSDRSAAQTGVERVIRMETERVNAAAGINATTNAIMAGNDLTNETNDLLAQQIAATRDVARAVAGLGIGGGGDVGVDYGITARLANLNLI